MGVWFYLCEIRPWAFSAAVADGHALCSGGVGSGVVCADTAWLFMDDVLDFIHRSDLAIWADIFWSGADAGNAGGAAGAK
jgi:hypothetical protein